MPGIHIAKLDNIETVRTDCHYSQGYLELRQAPQQDTHSVPSLWLVSPTPKLVRQSTRAEIAKFSTQSDEVGRLRISRVDWSLTGRIIADRIFFAPHRQAVFPYPEVDLCQLRLPCCQDPQVYAYPFSKSADGIRTRIWRSKPETLLC